MPANEYLTYALDPAALLLTQSQYNSDDDRVKGVKVGIADPKLYNKAQRQAAMAAAVLFQYMADTLGTDSLDDGDFPTAVSRFKSALSTLSGAALGSLANPRVDNNSGTPNTVVDATCDAVVLVDGAGAQTVVRAPGSKSASITASGAGGFDASGPAVANSFAKLFYIYKPSTNTLALIWSYNAVTAGPTLPSGYTLWKYVGTFRIDGSTHIVRQALRDKSLFFASDVAVVLGGSGGGGAVNNAVDLSGVVPAEAAMIFVQIDTDSGGGGGSGLARIGFISGSAFRSIAIADSGGGQSHNMKNDADVEFPNVGQNLYWSTDGGGIASINVGIGGYTLPNGAL